MNQLIFPTAIQLSLRKVTPLSQGSKHHRSPVRSAPEGAAGNTSTATAASGIVPAHCGPPTASGFSLCSVNLGFTEDRWRRATIMHAAGPLVLETLIREIPEASDYLR